MTASWLPTWPATWPDLVTLWREYVPMEAPRFLWKRGGQAWLDLQALGESLALARQFLEWVLRCYLPNRDTTGQLLERWEDDYRLQPAATVADRIIAVIAKMREPGTLTILHAKELLCSVFGTNDPAEVSCVYPLAADMTTAADATGTTEQQWAEMAFQVHWYSTGEDVEPNQSLFERLWRRIAPVTEDWSCGRYCYAEYDDDTETEQGEYDQSCYDGD
jgi:hypothetical protein